MQSHNLPDFLSHPGQHSLVKLLMRASWESASHVHARCLWAPGAGFVNFWLESLLKHRCNFE